LCCLTSRGLTMSASPYWNDPILCEVALRSAAPSSSVRGRFTRQREYQTNPSVCRLSVRRSIQPDDSQSWSNRCVAMVSAPICRSSRAGSGTRDRRRKTEIVGGVGNKFMCRRSSWCPPTGLSRQPISQCRDNRQKITTKLRYS